MFLFSFPPPPPICVTMSGNCTTEGPTPVFKRFRGRVGALMAEMYIFCFPIFSPNMSSICVLLFLQSSYSRLWASKWVGNGDAQKKLQLLRMPSKKSIPLLPIILQASGNYKSIGKFS